MHPLVRLILASTDVKDSRATGTPIEPAIITIATRLRMHKPRVVTGTSVEDCHVGYRLNVNPRDDAHPFCRNIVRINIRAIQIEEAASDEMRGFPELPIVRLRDLPVNRAIIPAPRFSNDGIAVKVFVVKV